MAHDATIVRCVSPEKSVLLARGVFTGLFVDYFAHSHRWVGDPDGLVSTMMRQGLAAAALYLTCRPGDEETAWTFNLPEPPLNLYFVADASRGRVVGRYFDRHVRSEANSRLFVQTVRGFAKPHESVIDVRGFDVLEMLESFYARSEQTSARFFEDAGDGFLMLMALPGIDEAWLHGLTREAARAMMAEGGTHEIERRLIRFGCACNEERIMEVATQIFARRPEELFGGDEDAEILCPRCGQAYRVERARFDAELRRQAKAGSSAREGEAGGAGSAGGAGGEAPDSPGPGGDPDAPRD